MNLRTLPAPVQAEATTESNFVHIAALCPATKSVASQPETIELPGGKRYTPDYCVETQDGGQSFWEVKLESRIGSYRHRFALAAAHFSQRGAPFFVISEKQLRDGRLHRDARLILRYAKASYSPQPISDVLQCLQASPDGLSIADLRERLQVPRELLFHLIAQRQITFARGVGTTETTVLKATQSTEFTNALHLARWFNVSPWRANP
ncbi:MAG: hypothetical protein EKK53_28260 [Burkholderiales bacterium]|nr:MAG: hypothetical protein EKK53_28260 [Burkholderiales bacterium]